MKGVSIFTAPTPPLVQIETTQSAIEARAEILAIARLAPSVTNAATRQEVVNIMGEIKRLLLDAEKARKALKEPFLEAGRMLDQEKTAFIAPLLRAYDNLDAQVTNWETQQRELAAEEERIKQAELDKLKAALPAPANEMEAAGQAAFLADQAEALGPNLTPEPAKGQSVREAWDYEVLDLARLWAIYGARLVSLVEKRQAILDLINSPDCPSEMIHGVRTPKLPGLRIKRKLANRIQPTRQPVLIDVQTEEKT